MKKTRFACMLATVVCLLGASPCENAKRQDDGFYYYSVPVQECSFRLDVDGSLRVEHRWFNETRLANDRKPEFSMVSIKLAELPAAWGQQVKPVEARFARQLPNGEWTAKPLATLPVALTQSKIASEPPKGGKIASASGPGSHTGTGGGKGQTNQSSNPIGLGKRATTLGTEESDYSTNKATGNQPSKMGVVRGGPVAGKVPEFKIAKIEAPPKPNNPNASATKRHNAEVETISAVNSIGDELVRLNNNLVGLEKTQESRISVIEDQMKVVQELLLKIVQNSASDSSQ